ncbi:hypothetical protein H4582DRAFT_2062294 [Lactarius indigo]|nr:hypothetical protein H4582DRAFT_2062285 [Lactarius indigo]KAI9431870.1 hypothetical protein H4582DRAFT_2062294 [Lactarius indigo]
MTCRPTGWHGKSGAARWGGHVTADFRREDGVHITTHHAFPTEAAYGRKVIDSRAYSYRCTCEGDRLLRKMTVSSSNTNLDPWKPGTQQPTLPPRHHYPRYLAVSLPPLQPKSHRHRDPLYHVTVAAVIGVTRLTLAECLCGGILVGTSKSHKERKR